MNAQPKHGVLTIVDTVMGEQMQKPATQSVNQSPVSKTVSTAVRATPKKKSVTRSVTAKKQITKPVNEPMPKNETAPAQSLTKRPEPSHPQMSASELVVNFGKGAVNSYTTSLTECFKPLAFLVNNGIMIMKGFSHLAMPLLMTYFLITQVAFIQSMISQSGNQAVGLAYSVSFYFASALIWFTSWVAIVGLGKSIKSACYKMALKGRTL